jgi:hypothetical protein
MDLAVNQPTIVTTPNTQSQLNGGRERIKPRTRKMPKTGIRGRGKYLKGWANQQPGYHDRTVMFKNCGETCFLGPRKTFPICTRNTCKVNRKGLYAAYIRAEEYKTLRKDKGNSKYYRISSKARKLLAKTRKQR